MIKTKDRKTEKDPGKITIMCQNTFLMAFLALFFKHVFSQKEKFCNARRKKGLFFFRENRSNQDG
jgi:hypothetical protein